VSPGSKHSSGSKGLLNQLHELAFKNVDRGVNIIDNYEDKIDEYPESSFDKEDDERA
jgi:hypothetical protein